MKFIRSSLKFTDGDSSPSFSTIKKWAAEFKRGRTSLEDYPYEGRPKDAATPEIIEQVRDMVLDDGRMKVTESNCRQPLTKSSARLCPFFLNTTFRMLALLPSSDKKHLTWLTL
jgi:hypothetical protein